SANPSHKARLVSERSRHTKRREARAEFAPAAEDSSIFSRWAVEVPANLRDGALGCAAAAFDKIPRGLPHLRRPLGMAQELDPRNARVFRTFNLDSGSSRGESLGNFSEVFHGRAKHRNLSERRRLKNVVTTARNERAANESAVGHAVKRSELADTVQQNDRHVVGNGKFTG